MHIPYKNSEGYPDPTAQQAMTNVMRDYEQQQHDNDQRTSLLIKVIKHTIDLSGYELLERIQVKDRKTGRIYR